MKIQHGDLIKLGNSYLLCGDATNADDVKRLLDWQGVSLILSDPPYGCAVVESKASFTGKEQAHKPIKNDQIQTENEYQVFTDSWLKLVSPHMKDYNTFYVFGIDKMVFPIRFAMEQNGFRFGQLLTWAKTHAVVGRLDYLPQTEMIVYGWKGRHKFLKSKDKNVIVYPKPNKSKYHSTMKPIGLLRRLILNSTEIGDVVYDPFLGSGSTLIACEQTQRKCLGIEIEPEYCETICMLYEKFLGIKPEKVDKVV